jgi:hypothetical protein
VKKTITVGCLLGTLLIYLLTIHFSDMVMQFLVAGAIPGTDYFLPASFVLQAITLVVIVAIFARLERYISSRNLTN